MAVAAVVSMGVDRAAAPAEVFMAAVPAVQAADLVAVAPGAGAEAAQDLVMPDMVVRAVVPAGVVLAGVVQEGAAPVGTDEVVAGVADGGVHGAADGVVPVGAGAVPAG